ncbi:MAG: glucokinase [Geobacter sp.]|nr:MAG: glucokinase [Geobacter sp.]
MQVLAGDIGGTSARLAWVAVKEKGCETLAERWYRSREHGSPIDVVRKFVHEFGVTVDRACFGVAGPVREGRVQTPNLPWSVDGAELARALGLPAVGIINDLEAHAYGIDLLKDEDLAVLNSGVATEGGTIAVISAGTGLGVAFAYWDGTAHRPLPSEGGHADFAPRNELEAELLLYLRTEHGRVSCERVISGPGLRNIYRFLRDRKQIPESPKVAVEMLADDSSRVISSAALEGSCELCVRSLDLFASLYGAEAGNVALRYLATGGIYVGGGIAPKIIDKLREPAFMIAFTAKGRLSPLLETIPVRVILNERSALLGAARCAALEG